MAITKAFGYRIRCDINYEVKEGEKVVGQEQCQEVILALVKKHSGKTGGLDVRNVALQHKWSFNLGTNKYACPKCWAKMSEASRLAEEKKNPMIAAPTLYDAQGEVIKPENNLDLKG